MGGPLDDGSRFRCSLRGGWSVNLFWEHSWSVNLFWEHANGDRRGTTTDRRGVGVGEVIDGGAAFRCLKIGVGPSALAVGMLRDLM